MSRESRYPAGPPDGLEDRALPPMAFRIVVFRGVQSGILEYTTDGTSCQGGGFSAEVDRVRRNLHTAVDGLAEKITREGWSLKGVQRDDGEPGEFGDGL